MYQILKAEPDLIQSLFPSIWQEAEISVNAELGLPTSSEIKVAFEKMSCDLNVDRKFCLFIDGLDEYHGNLMEGIELIKSLIRNTDIKIVVASRPISECFQAFSSMPKLRLQHLTKVDIQRYIYDIVGRHEYMESLAADEPDLAPEIVDQLLQKACGVFLWVVLACRSLIEGFAAYDKAGELLERVAELPIELEDLFRHMLRNLKPRYRSQATEMLRLCHEAQCRGIGAIPCLAMAVVEHCGVKGCNFIPMPYSRDEKRHSKCVALEGRVRSRCCGLVELQWSPEMSSDEQCCFCSISGHHHDRKVDSVVNFIHRTVLDFFSRPGAWDYEWLAQVGPVFDPLHILSCIQLQGLALGGPWV